MRRATPWKRSQLDEALNIFDQSFEYCTLLFLVRNKNIFEFIKLKRVLGKLNKFNGKLFLLFYI